ncbi:hypothetical protein [Ancylobacter oerskovii]|uniref:Uncharacterized protein n=1 Tax=Ancylobacter oerskovii TaxID=459519 RepID=A0ABW4Z4A7_9HYPH|nr:hypothetical protein [Ancylobacter oerskovii]MBS7546293.1 hypothetical protein [Ancylobacter oerskovii]
MSSGNIVDRLRAMAADLDGFPRDKVEDELSEAADVIERLRSELDKYLPPVEAPTASSTSARDDALPVPPTAVGSTS